MMSFSMILAALMVSSTALLHAKDNSFSLVSPAFEHNANIPLTYACSSEGSNHSPPLKWSGAPSNTQSYALVCYDPDAPNGFFVHWVIYNIPSSVKQLAEGVDRDEELANGILQGVNSFDHVGYDGPCPPPGKPHRYVFRLYALDFHLSIDPGSNYKEFEKAIKGHTLSQTDLIGLFSR